MKKQRKAFTLIELLVVINIIGILAAISTTSYMKVIQQARAAVASTAGGFVAHQLESFAASNNGRYPTQGRALDPVPFPLSQVGSGELRQIAAAGGFGKAPGPFSDATAANIQNGMYSIARINSLDTSGGPAQFGIIPNNGLTLKSISQGATPIKVGDEIIPTGNPATETFLVNNTIFYDSDGSNYVAYGFYRRGNRTLVTAKATNVN